jgi:hypothetical protein
LNILCSFFLCIWLYLFILGINLILLGINILFVDFVIFNNVCLFLFTHLIISVESLLKFRFQIWCLVSSPNLIVSIKWGIKAFYRRGILRTDHLVLFIFIVFHYSLVNLLTSSSCRTHYFIYLLANSSLILRTNSSLFLYTHKSSYVRACRLALKVTLALVFIRVADRTNLTEWLDLLYCQRLLIFIKLLLSNCFLFLQVSRFY